jgi:hypothetical protein
MMMTLCWVNPTVLCAFSKLCAAVVWESRMVREKYSFEIRSMSETEEVIWNLFQNNQFLRSNPPRAFIARKMRVLTPTPLHSNNLSRVVKNPFELQCLLKTLHLLDLLISTYLFGVFILSNSFLIRCLDIILYLWKVHFGVFDARKGNVGAGKYLIR